MTLLCNSNGFSFLGLVAIVLVMGVATALVVASLQPQLMQDRTQLTFQRMDQVKLAVANYRTDHGGASPASLNDLVTPTAPACAVDTNTASPTYRQLTGWCGPYIDQVFQQDADAFERDGWNTLFQYTSTQLTSCGPDKTCGNSDDLKISL